MEEKKPFGRPSKYKDHYPELLLEHMAKGHSYKSFVAVIMREQMKAGVKIPHLNLDTLYNWEKLFPDFSEAKKAGRMAQELFWEELGIANATGEVKGNATHYVWMTKNMLNWTDKHEITTGEDSNIQINLVRKGENKDD